MLMPGYSYVCTLGQGARSRIVQVAEIRTGRMFALKRIIRNDEDDDRFIEQGENEFSVASEIDHPAVRKCFQIRRVRKWMRIRELQILMEHVDGKTLEERRPTDLREIVRIFHAVADGLDGMHRAGYAHADMKPNNIMLASGGKVKIIDLGQSCPLGHVKRRIQGTPDYIAPEQVRRLPIERTTDVFNFGATLYWLLTGTAYPTILPSKKSATGIDLLPSREAVLPHLVNAEIPLALSTLVMDCCMESASDRPADMQKVLSRLMVAEHMLTRGAGAAALGASGADASDAGGARESSPANRRT
jgi:serine/threonine-protein kinase